MSEMVCGNIRLRPWREEDACALIATASCAHVREWLKDWEGVEEWAASWIEGQLWRHEKGEPMQEFMSWAITVPPSDTPIGVINLGGDEMDHQGVSLSYFLHEGALHKGYATEAVLALSAYAFERWDFPEILASVEVENSASLAVLERAGFAFLEERMTLLDGYEEDVLCAWYVIKRAAD